MREVGVYIHPMLVTTRSHSHTELQGMLGNVVSSLVPEPKLQYVQEREKRFGGAIPQCSVIFSAKPKSSLIFSHLLPELELCLKISMKQKIK